MGWMNSDKPITPTYYKPLEAHSDTCIYLASFEHAVGRVQLKLKCAFRLATLSFAKQRHRKQPNIVCFDFISHRCNTSAPSHYYIFEIILPHHLRIAS